MKIKLTESQLKLVLKEAQNLYEDVIQPELKKPTIPCKSYKGEKTKVWKGLTNACIKTSNLQTIGKFNDTSGENRKEGCNGKTPKGQEWLYGCRSHPYGDTAYLYPEAADSFNKMNDDYKKEKKRREGIYVESAYRDFFHQSAVDPGENPQAKPGQSNHGFGLALDINRWGGRAWMKKNGGKYGWCHHGSGDKPHFNYFPTLKDANLKFKCANYAKAKKQWDNERKFKPSLQSGTGDRKPKTYNKFKEVLYSWPKDHEWQEYTKDDKLGDLPFLKVSDFMWEIDNNPEFVKKHPRVIVGNYNYVTQPGEESLMVMDYNENTGEWEINEKIFSEIVIEPKVEDLPPIDLDNFPL